MSSTLVIQLYFYITVFEALVYAAKQLATPTYRESTRQRCNNLSYDWCAGSVSCMYYDSINFSLMHPWSSCLTSHFLEFGNTWLCRGESAFALVSLPCKETAANRCAEPPLQIPKRWNFQNKPSPTTGGAATPARDSSLQSEEGSGATVGCCTHTQSSTIPTVFSLNSHIISCVCCFDVPPSDSRTGLSRSWFQLPKSVSRLIH